MSGTSLDVLLAPGALSVVFQPILDVAAGGTRLFGLEALLRGSEGSKLDSADALFAYVRGADAELAADRACVVAALEASRSLPPAARLSLNVHARTLVEDEEFPRFLAEQSAGRGIGKERLTLDVVEHAAVGPGARLLEAFQEARRLGFRIALDDIRLSDADQCTLVACRPDDLKLDRLLVTGCDADRDRRGLLAAAQRLAARLEAGLIVEGVERQAELDVVLDLGIHLVQGYLLCPPLAVSALEERDLFERTSEAEGDRSLAFAGRES